MVLPLNKIIYTRSTVVEITLVRIETALYVIIFATLNTTDTTFSTCYSLTFSLFTLLQYVLVFADESNGVGSVCGAGECGGHE